MRRVFVYFAGLLLISGIARAEHTLHLGATDFAPYYSQSLPGGGPVTKVVVAAYRLMGYRVIVHFYPWARALEMGKMGALDGLSGVWRSRSREKWFLFSSPVCGSDIVLYKRKETPIKEFTTFKALKPYSVGIVRGYALPPGFKEAGLHVQKATTNLQNFRMLEAKRVDLIIIDRGVAQYLLRTRLQGCGDIFDMLSPPVDHRRQYLVISQKTPDALQKIKDFNAGLKLLESEGKIGAVLKNNASASSQ